LISGLFFRTLPAVVNAIHVETCCQQQIGSGEENATNYSGSLSPKRHNVLV
jgi:hypothetical protein